jgi:membrane protein YdbS with pleckstrin-like domain
MTWREGEVAVISVTPVARGLARPVLSLVTAVVLVHYGARLNLIHEHEPLLMLVVAGPCLLVVLTRLWRWRSHKIRVTSERVIVEGGVLRHYRSLVELRDVIAIRVEQRFVERVARRGSVILETSAGPLDVGRVHHPAALCRLIEAERAGNQQIDLPLDTVFEYGQPDPYDFQVNAPERGREWDGSQTRYRY